MVSKFRVRLAKNLNFYKAEKVAVILVFAVITELQAKRLYCTPHMLWMGKKYFM